MKRRLKNEILMRKKSVTSGALNDQDAKDFEESLIKLATLAKNKVKVADFSSKDRFNLLDLFVNNEKTLIKIYEALFPHRVQSQTLGLAAKNSVTTPAANFTEDFLNNSDVMQQLAPEQRMFPKIGGKNLNESGMIDAAKRYSIRGSSLNKQL